MVGSIEILTAIVALVVADRGGREHQDIDSDRSTSGRADRGRRDSSRRQESIKIELMSEIQYRYNIVHIIVIIADIVLGTMIAGSIVTVDMMNDRKSNRDE